MKIIPPSKPATLASGDLLQASGYTASTWDSRRALLGDLCVLLPPYTSTSSRLWGLSLDPWLLPLSCESRSILSSLTAPLCSHCSPSRCAKRGHAPAPSCHILSPRPLSFTIPSHLIFTTSQTPAPISTPTQTTPPIPRR